MPKATVQQMKAFFGVENKELMEFKKQDSEGYSKLANELGTHLDQQK